MSDLFVTCYTPTLGVGRAVRGYGLVRALAAMGSVDVLYARFGAEWPAPEFESVPGVSLYGVRPSRGLRRALAYAGARADGVPAAFARAVSPELTGAAAALAGRPCRERVVADGPGAAAALRGLAARRPVVYSAQNIESAFRHEGLDSGGMGSRRGLAAFERRLLESFAESWIVSRADLERARELAPGARLRLVPNVVDVEAIAPVPAHSTRRRALMVADFTYEPNRDGLSFLVSDVLPRVWTEISDVRLTIVGRGLEAPTSPDERVEQLGFVEDLAAAYAGADCAVVPLRVGGGSPLKFVEALAYGLPVVATPRAAAGLDAKPGVHYLEGDGADAFAAALVRALRDGAPDVARRGRKLAEAEYSIAALTQRLAPADSDEAPA